MQRSKISALNLKGLLFHCASLYENQYYTMQAKLQLLHQNCNELSMGPMQAEKKVVPVRPIKIKNRDSVRVGVADPQLILTTYKRYKSPQLARIPSEILWHRMIF